MSPTDATRRPTRTGHDSAGVPFAGRELAEHRLRGRHRCGRPGPVAALARPARRPRPDAAVEGGRFLVPVVAEPAETDDSGEHTVEKQTDMAAVTLVAPDGQRALPVFTGTDGLAAWDPEARPVPVTAARAGQAAVSEGCDVIVVDVAGPATRVLRPSHGLGPGPAAALAARPRGRPLRRRAVAAAVRDERAVIAHELEEGNPPARACSE